MLILITGGSALVVFTLIAAQISRPAITRLQPASPWDRSWALLAVASAPLLLTLLTVGALFLPGVNGLVSGSHCHDPACLPHTPSLDTAMQRGAWVMAGVLLFPILGAGVLTVAAIWRSTRVSALLSLLSEQRDGSPIHVLPSRVPSAMCLGLVKPVVVISAGLEAGLSPRQREIVILHEKAHAVRFDNLRRLIANVSTCAWPRTPRAALLAALSAAAEQSCDAAVVAAGFPADEVAGTIRRMAHLVDPVPDSEVCPETEARIGLLLKPAATTGGFGRVEQLRGLAVAVVLTCALAALASATILHQLTEHLFGLS